MKALLDTGPVGVGKTTVAEAGGGPGHVTVMPARLIANVT